MLESLIGPFSQQAFGGRALKDTVPHRVCRLLLSESCLRADWVQDRGGKPSRLCALDVCSHISVGLCSNAGDRIRAAINYAALFLEAHSYRRRYLTGGVSQ